MHEAAAEPISLRPLVTSPDDDPLAAILHQGDELLLAQAIEAEVPGVDRSSAA